MCALNQTEWAPCQGSLDRAPWHLRQRAQQLLQAKWPPRPTAEPWQALLQDWREIALRRGERPRRERTEDGRND